MVSDERWQMRSRVDLPQLGSPPPRLSQSLAQIKVLHLHAVPFSCRPLGPRGRLHIQNVRPQLTPAFLVTMVLHGSPWSQLGEMGLEKSVPHD